MPQASMGVVVNSNKDEHRTSPVNCVPNKKRGAFMVCWNASFAGITQLRCAVQGLRV
jgi:hypothetical protein